MNIDLDTSEGRRQYLSDKLDDLLDGINESYGTVLMEELLCRLELTIKDFNDEMKILFTQLVKKQQERQNLLEMLSDKEGIIGREIQSISSSPISSENNDKKSVNNENQAKSIQDSTPVGKIISKEKELKENIPTWEKKLAKLEKK